MVGGWWMLINCDDTLITEEKARLVNEYAVKVTEMPLYYDKNRSLLIKNSTTLTFGTVRDRGMSTLFILNKVSCSPHLTHSTAPTAPTYIYFFIYFFAAGLSTQARNLEKIITECLLLHACWIKPDQTHSEEDRARIASDNALILSKYSQGLAMFRQELQNSAGTHVPSLGIDMFTCH